MSSTVLQDPKISCVTLDQASDKNNIRKCHTYAIHQAHFHYFFFSATVKYFCINHPSCSIKATAHRISQRCQGINTHSYITCASLQQRHPVESNQAEHSSKEANRWKINEQYMQTISRLEVLASGQKGEKSPTDVCQVNESVHSALDQSQTARYSTTEPHTIEPLLISPYSGPKLTPAAEETSNYTPQNGQIRNTYMR